MLRRVRAERVDAERDERLAHAVFDPVKDRSDCLDWWHCERMADQAELGQLCAGVMAVVVPIGRPKLFIKI
jgi:hypothetical protein